MHILLLIAILLALVIGPGLWVRRVMQKYAAPADRYGHTGAETARKLLDTLGLKDVGVEIADGGDHYDPQDRVVRLSADNHRGRSLTAVTVAAHEVGHAVQHASGYRPLLWRTRLVRWLGPVEKTGAMLMMATPIIIGLTRLPMAGLLVFLGGLLTLGSGVVIHLLTLPTEFDASFGRAMPLLRRHEVLYGNDMPHARRLLLAAAMTYVSASLMSLLNVARWWSILRR
ncbi:MAG: zinc metallopeptidase [Lysobacterales bacterium]|jgi:Zn-dependent membrane protease YugP